MTATICILLIENAFAAWLLTNSPVLGLCVVLVWATWFVAMRYGNHEHRFSRLDSSFLDLKKGQWATNKKMAKVDSRVTRMDSRVTRMDGRLTRMDGRLSRMEGRLTRVEGQLNVIIVMLRRSKPSSSDETQATQQTGTHLTTNR